MSKLLSRETELLLQERVKAMGLDSVDQLVGFALDAFESNVFLPDELDEETWAAIEAADASGESIPWEQVKRERFEKYVTNTPANGEKQ